MVFLVCAGTGTVCGASPGLHAGSIAENQWSA